MAGDYSTSSINAIGDVHTKPKLEYCTKNRKYYMFLVRIKRQEGIGIGKEDIIPIMFSDIYYEKYPLEIGQKVCIKGHVESYNKKQNNKLIHPIFVFAEEIKMIEVKEGDRENYCNKVYLKGTFKKELAYHCTPQRGEIYDFMLFVTRYLNDKQKQIDGIRKREYLPICVNGEEAYTCYKKEFQEGDVIFCTGILQSREYEKKDKDGKRMKKIAYEVLAHKVEKVDNLIENELGKSGII